MDVDSARRYIEESLPGFEVERISNEGEGDFSVAYTVNGEWIFRFARSEEASRSLRCEAALLPRLAQKITMRVPRIEHVGTQGEDGLLFAGHRKIEGVALAGELFWTLSEGERDRCVEELARFLREMHAFSPEVAKEAGVVECDYPFCRTEEGIARGTAREEYGSQLERLLSYPRVGGGTGDYCARIVERLLDGEGGLKRVPVHGDLSAEHVLFDVEGRRISGVIDFSDVVITDPALDVMYLYAAYGAAFLDAFLPRYDAGRVEEMRGRVLALYGWYTAIRLLWALEHDYEQGVSLRLEQLGELRARTLQEG